MTAQIGVALVEGRIRAKRVFKRELASGKNHGQRGHSSGDFGGKAVKASGLGRCLLVEGSASCCCSKNRGAV